MFTVNRNFRLYNELNEQNWQCQIHTTWRRWNPLRLRSVKTEYKKNNNNHSFVCLLGHTLNNKQRIHLCFWKFDDLLNNQFDCFYLCVFFFIKLILHQFFTWLYWKYLRVIVLISQISRIKRIRLERKIKANTSCHLAVQIRCFQQRMTKHLIIYLKLCWLVTVAREKLVLYNVSKQANTKNDMGIQLVLIFPWKPSTLMARKLK